MPQSLIMLQMISSSARLPHNLCAFIIPFLINSLTLKDWHSTECEQGVKATVIFYKGILAAFDNGVKLIVMQDRKSTRLNSSHVRTSRMPSSA